MLHRARRGAKTALKQVINGYICVYAKSADMSAAVTRQRTGTLRNIFMIQGILSCSRLRRAKTGCGVTKIRNS